MDEGETVVCVAVCAQSRLGNAASVHFSCGCERAYNAFKEGFTHFWDDIRRSDDHSTYGNQLVDV